MEKLSINKQLAILEADIGKKSPRTKAYYLPVAKRFLTESGDFSRAGMIKWLDNSGYCDNSVRTVYYVLKRLCKSLDKTFPLDTEDRPPLPDEEDIYTPTKSVNEVRRLISFWRNYPGDYLTSLVFMSTVYGLRAVEMTNVEIRKDSIVVIVAKRKPRRGGKRITREHPVPEGMMRYLSGYVPMSEMTVKYAFWKVCRRAGVSRKHKENWHSVRRRINTTCTDLGISKAMLKRFLRWTRDTKDMADVYYHKDFQEINTEMFKVHPFLPLWS